ncbi:helix-turn-helix domain-containing protein [Streptomyces fagopyri]|uniref:helix-turn-helix domain-containing protein n=1 Tax=Streptomyces fagopyri TaxID=2662397 RepID=UPI0033D4170C
MNDTADLVRFWRGQRSRSQARLAELAGTGTGQVATSRIESGRDQPTPALLERIASALDCQLRVTFTSDSKAAPQTDSIA